MFWTICTFLSKVKTKRIFYGGESTTDKIQQEERCDLNTKLQNRYFSPNHEIPLNLKIYNSIVKKEVAKLLKKKPNNQQSNLTSEKSLKLRYLSETRILTIKGADKGRKLSSWTR